MSSGAKMVLVGSDTVQLERLDRLAHHLRKAFGEEGNIQRSKDEHGLSSALGCNYPSGRLIPIWASITCPSSLHQSAKRHSGHHEWTQDAEAPSPTHGHLEHFCNPIMWDSMSQKIAWYQCGFAVPDNVSSASYRLGAVDVSGQADNQIVGDGVHQVSEAGVAIQHVVQRCWLHAQVLQKHQFVHLDPRFYTPSEKKTSKHKLTNAFMETPTPKHTVVPADPLKD